MGNIENNGESNLTNSVEFKKLYLILDKNNRVLDLTFEETEFFYQEVSADAALEEIRSITGIGELELIYENNCLIGAPTKAEDKEIEKNVYLLEQKIHQLTESIEMRDDLIQELALMVYGHESMA
ncbi:TPA: hypothetical protein ACGO1T_000536 [Streptococcus suis]